MRRIILKSQLNNRFGLLQRLADINLEFSDVYFLHDRVYVPKNYRPSSNFPHLSLRTVVKKPNHPADYFLIFHRHLKDSEIDLIETSPLKDYTSMANIISQLGFTLKAEIDRQRRELILGEAVRMYTDFVEGLDAEYLKIESDLTELDDPVSVRNDLADTLITLDQHPDDIVKAPYITLLSKADSKKSTKS